MLTVLFRGFILLAAIFAYANANAEIVKIDVIRVEGKLNLFTEVWFDKDELESNEICEGVFTDPLTNKPENMVRIVPHNINIMNKKNYEFLYIDYTGKRWFRF